MAKTPKNKNAKDKKEIHTSQSSDSEEEHIEVTIESGSEEEMEMDEREFKKYLKRIYPNTKNLNSKIKEIDKIDKEIDKERKNKKSKKNVKKDKEVVSSKSSKKDKVKSTNKNEKIKSKKDKIKKNKKYESSEESDPDFNPSDLEFSDEEEMDEEELEQLLKESGMQMSLVFTMGGKEDYEEYESYEESETDTEEELEEEEENVEENSVELDEESEYRSILQELKKHVKGKNEKGRREVYEKLEHMAIQEQERIKKEEKKKQKKKQKKNTKQFRSLIQNKDIMNDYKYFEKLEVEKQEEIIEEIKKVNNVSKQDKPYRIKLLESKIPAEYKQHAIKKINNLKYMDPASGEYYKVKQWVDGFMNIPFGTYSKIPYSLKENSIDEIHGFMEKSKDTLNNIVYGLDDAKLQIMQIIGQWISNPEAIGNAIAIKGPMGTGKTTLVKEGVSKILNRPFAFIALGGATDSSFLEGHSYTYEGSLWGKIVDILMQSKSMNPVIYFDELDKVSDTPKGEEIIGILTHLTDTTQNSQYHDKYFANIDFDLSKVLFIFSYNHEEKVNPILKDRMYHIETKGYDNKEKNIIANKYLLPKIQENVAFEDGQIIIPNETLEYINTNLTNNEKGVRNLKRCLETIYTKLNLFRLMKTETNLFDKDISLKVEFPFTVTPEIIQKLVKHNAGEKPPYGMYT